MYRRLQYRRQKFKFGNNKSNCDFLIIFSSALPYGGVIRGANVYVDLKQTEFTLSHILFTLFRWGGQIGDTFFIVCSAWFLCESKKIKLNKIMNLISDSWVISLSGLIIALFFLKPTVIEFIKSIFPVTCRTNWFVGCYVTYYIIHPFLNRAMEGISQKEFRNICIVLFMVYSIASNVYGGIYYFTDLIAFISIHIIIMYKKKFQIHLFDSINILLIILSITLITLWVVGINYISIFMDVFKNLNLMFCKYNNPFIIIMSISVLDIAVKRKCYIRIINQISSMSLLIYLIHSNYFWLNYGKYKIIDILFGIVESLSLVHLILICIYVIVLPLLVIGYRITLASISVKISKILKTALTYCFNMNFI